MFNRGARGRATVPVALMDSAGLYERTCPLFRSMDSFQRVGLAAILVSTLVSNIVRMQLCWWVTCWGAGEWVRNLEN